MHVSLLLLLVISDTAALVVHIYSVATSFLDLFLTFATDVQAPNILNISSTPKDSFKVGSPKHAIQ